jgi:hypothetical protein
MKRYHITVLGYYRNSDTTHSTTIDSDGMSYSNSGVYEFWNKVNGVCVPFACYPIRQTVISRIEYLEKQDYPEIEGTVALCEDIIKNKNI